MALIYNGTTIPSSATIKYNGTTLTKIIYNGVTVWQKVTDVTQNFGTHAYVSHVGTADPCNKWDGWDVTLTNKGVVKSISLGSASSTCMYSLYGSNDRANWTALKENFTSGTYTISNATAWKYLNLNAYGVSRSAWEEPAGWYYWKEAVNFTVTYTPE